LKNNFFRAIHKWRATDRVATKKFLTDFINEYCDSVFDDEFMTIMGIDLPEKLIEITKKEEVTNV